MAGDGEGGWDAVLVSARKQSSESANQSESSCKALTHSCVKVVTSFSNAMR